MLIMVTNKLSPKNKMLKWSSIIIIMLIAAMCVGVLYYYNNRNQKQIFSGKISDLKRCEIWIGGAECTWIVSGKSVTYVWGSSLEAANSAGKVDGLRLNKSDIGKNVEVKAKKITRNKYKLSESSDYIVVK